MLNALEKRIDCILWKEGEFEQRIEKVRRQEALTFIFPDA